MLQHPRKGGVPEGPSPVALPQLCLPLQEVWPSAVSRGGGEAEEPLHPDAQRHPAARAGERPPLQHPHHCPVSSAPSSPPKTPGIRAAFLGWSGKGGRHGAGM